MFSNVALFPAILSTDIPINRGRLIRMRLSGVARVLNRVLRHFGARIIAERGNIPSSIVRLHDPSHSYMHDSGITNALLDELAEIADAHFLSITPTAVNESLDLKAEIRQFFSVYAGRPFIENTGGSGFHNAFWLYLTARMVAPQVFIESGVWKAHTTWLISKAIPDASIFAYDIDLSRVEYSGPAIEFHQFDWSVDDADKFAGKACCAYFDCHIDHARRILEARQRGIKYLLFDDDPPLEKLYAYLLPGFPTASMLSRGQHRGLVSPVKWVSRGKNVEYEFDESQAEEAASLIKTHRHFPDVGGPTMFGGFSYLSFVELR